MKAKEYLESIGIRVDTEEEAISILVASHSRQKEIIGKATQEDALDILNGKRLLEAFSRL